MSKPDIVRLAQIGLGASAMAIAEAVGKRSKQTQLITCFDLIPERRKIFSERFGGRLTFASTMRIYLRPLAGFFPCKGLVQIEKCGRR